MKSKESSGVSGDESRSVKEDQVWRRVYSGGCLSIVGVPLMLVGGYAVAFPFLESEDAPTVDTVISAAAIGLTMIALGVCLTFMRFGLVIDPHAQVITRWWGLLVPFRKSEQPLEKYDHVFLDEEIRSSRQRSYKVYALRLSGAKNSILLEDFSDLVEARNEAEKASSIFKMELRISYYNHESIRQPDELNLTLKERYLKSQVTLPDVPRPKSLETEIQREGGLVSVKLPRGYVLDDGRLHRRKNIWNVVAYLSIVWVGWIVASYLFVELKNKQPAMFGVTAIIVGWLAIWGLRNLMTWFVRRGWYGPMTITATAGKITFERKSPFGMETITIPGSELEELLLSKPPRVTGLDDIAPIARGFAARMAESFCAITARSDSYSLSFGAGLPYKELRYIHSLLFRSVVE